MNKKNSYMIQKQIINIDIIIRLKKLRLYIHDINISSLRNTKPINPHTNIKEIKIVI